MERFTIRWMYFFFGIVILQLAACGGAGGEATATLTSPVEEATNTATASATNLPPGPPTSAPGPTETTSAFPSPTSRLDYLKTPEFATQAVSLPEAFSWMDVSPDGSWTARGQARVGIVVADTEYVYVQLLVSSQGGSIQWLVEDVFPAGLGFVLPEPVFWSPDGTAMFYSNAGTQDGCGLFRFGDLWRMDLSDGSLTEILGQAASIPAMSPDGSRVAYVPWGSPPELALRYIASGLEQRLPLELEGDMAGDIVWAPDGSALLLTVSVDSCEDGWKQGILKVDAATFEQTILITPDGRLLRTLEWPEPGTARLQDKDKKIWLLDVETGALTAEGG